MKDIIHPRGARNDRRARPSFRQSLLKQDLRPGLLPRELTPSCPATVPAHLHRRSLTSLDVIRVFDFLQIDTRNQGHHTCYRSEFAAEPHRQEDSIPAFGKPGPEYPTKRHRLLKVRPTQHPGIRMPNTVCTEITSAIRCP